MDSESKSGGGSVLRGGNDTPGGVGGGGVDGRLGGRKDIGSGGGEDGVKALMAVLLVDLA